MELDLSKADFEQRMQPYFERSMVPVREALRSANLTKEDIDEVILVGGSTRITKVETMLSEFFGKPCNKQLNPDEAVAIGATIQAGMLRGKNLVADTTRNPAAKNPRQ